MRGLPLAVCAFAAVLASPLLAMAQGFSLDATPTPGATPTPTPAPIEVVPITDSDLAVPTATATPAPTRLPASFDPGLPGQWGYPGALRVVAASPGDPGVTQLAAGVEFFSEPGFIAEGKNHRRTVNTLAFDHALSRSLAMSAVVLNMANHSSATNPYYIAAIGDLDVSGRVSLPLVQADAVRLSAGIRGGVKLMQGDGPGKGVEDAASPYVRGLATLDTSSVRLSLDGGYFMDRSAALVPEDTEPDAGQLYAYGVSDYDAVLAGAAVDVPSWRHSPFAEVTTRIDLGAEGEPATIATAGVKFSSASRRVSVLAALDYGLTGKEIVAGRLRVPTWNLVGGFSWSFGTAGERPRRPRRVVKSNSKEDPAATKTGSVKGKVLAMATRGPIPNATVTVEGGPALVTDANGTFEASGVAPGTTRIDVHADGFQDRKSNSYVKAGHVTAVTLYLFAAVPATPDLQAASVRGRIISMKGKPIAATIRATNAGKTTDVRTDAKGAYKLDLLEGDYSLTITAPGMKTQTHAGTLKPRESFEVDFMLAVDKKKKSTKKKKGSTAKKTK